MQEGTHRPRLRTHCHQRTHQNADAEHLRSSVPPAEENPRYDEQGQRRPSPYPNASKAPTLYPVNITARSTLPGASATQSPSRSNTKPKSALPKKPRTARRSSPARTPASGSTPAASTRNSTPPRRLALRRSRRKSSWTPAVRRNLRAYGCELAGAVEDPALSSTCAASSPTGQPASSSPNAHGDLAERYLLDPKDPGAARLPTPKKKRNPPLFSLLGAEPVENLRYFTQISRIIHELARLPHYEMEEHGQLKVYLAKSELPLLFTVLRRQSRVGIAVSTRLCRTARHLSPHAPTVPTRTHHHRRHCPKPTTANSLRQTAADCF